MKFGDFLYERPDIDELKREFSVMLSEFESAQDYQKQSTIIERINEIRNEYESMVSICYIRCTSDVSNNEWEKEQDYIDQIQPIYDGLVSDYYNSLSKSKYKDLISEKWGAQIFNIAKLASKISSPEVFEDLSLENKLKSKYRKLLASSKVNFEGEERTLAQLSSFEQSDDREMRKKASEARYDFFRENSIALDVIYDNLVKVRTKIASGLGYNNFISLGYARLKRSDYNPQMVANFRKQVKELIVPLSVKLRENQAAHLGIDNVKYYDENNYFKTGNPTVKGDQDWIISKAEKMYSEMSKETNEFFRFMKDNDLMDLLSRKNKVGGGYTTYIPKYKATFIFANFKGTAQDINTITHEIGHAFQMFMCSDLLFWEYNFPTFETGEIHSMSMELLTWPWMDMFFEEDADKYKFSRLLETVLFIPYAVTVDEFQHYVYENPNVSLEERNTKWRELEKQYMPYKDYDGNSYLESGNMWKKQVHIYEDPFYYIEYAMARLCSYQFWKKANHSREIAWKDYLNLCSSGGSRSFTESIKLANLTSPFEDGCIESVINDINGWLDKNSIYERG